MPGMKWIEPILFSKVPETLFSAKYLATRGPKMRLGTQKWIGAWDSPHKGNSWYERNWANSFFKKFRKSCLQTDGWTDRWTDGRTDIGVNPVYPHSTFWGAGYNEWNQSNLWRGRNVLLNVYAFRKTGHHNCTLHFPVGCFLILPW